MEGKKLLDNELQTLKGYQEGINRIIVNLGRLDLQIDTLKRDKEKVIKRISRVRSKSNKNRPRITK
jgi:hypothetical protein